MIRRRPVVLTAVLTVVSSGLLFAAGYDDCQQAIREQITANNPKSEKTVFNAGSESHQDKSNKETEYRGEGRFSRHTGKVETFSWSCTFDTQKSTVSSAHYRVTTNDTGPAAGSAVPDLKDLVGARGGQAEGQLTSRGYTFARTKKEGNSSYSYWRETKTGNCVTIRTEEGRYQSIAYAPAADCK